MASGQKNGAADFALVKVGSERLVGVDHGPEGDMHRVDAVDPNLRSSP